MVPKKWLGSFGLVYSSLQVLNTLRIALTIGMGILVMLIGKLIDRFDNNRIYSVFWLGTFVTIVLIGIIIALVIKLSDRTKEIRDL